MNLKLLPRRRRDRRGKNKIIKMIGFKHKAFLCGLCASAVKVEVFL
jgi:hypothetical protein